MRQSGYCSISRLANTRQRLGNRHKERRPLLFAAGLDIFKTFDPVNRRFVSRPLAPTLAIFRPGCPLDPQPDDRSSYPKQEYQHLNGLVSTSKEL